MFNPLKYFKSNKQLKQELKETKEKLKDYKKVCHSLLEKSTPEIVIEKLLDRPIKWYDQTKLAKDEQLGYYTEAQAILRSPVFKNEKEAFITDLTKEIATKSPNHEHTIALRYSINGIQTLWERFGNIKNPEVTPKESTDPHSSL